MHRENYRRRIGHPLSIKSTALKNMSYRAPCLCQHRIPQERHSNEPNWAKSLTWSFSSQRPGNNYGLCAVGTVWLSAVPDFLWAWLASITASC